MPAHISTYHIYSIYKLESMVGVGEKHVCVVIRGTCFCEDCIEMDANSFGDVHL